MQIRPGMILTTKNIEGRKKGIILSNKDLKNYWLINNPD